MGTLALALTGLTTGNPTPGAFFEIRFAQGQVQGSTSLKKVLFIGEKTSAGTATENTIVYPLTSELDAITLGGTGSKIHRAFKRFSQVCKSALCYAVFPTEGSGTNASGTITLATQTTSLQVLSITVCGETISVAIPSGTTAIAAATLAVAQINLQTHWPVTAANGTSDSPVITMTARTDGTDGNHIRFRCSISSGAMTATASGGTLTTGATDGVLTTALTAILPDRYNYIVPCINPTTTSDARIGALVAQVDAQLLPITGIRQQVIVCSNASVSNAATFAAAANGSNNKPEVQTLWQKNSEWEPYEIAAHFAGVRFNSETGADPGVSYDGYGQLANDKWLVPKPYLDSDRPSSSDIQTALSGGLTPIAVNAQGKTYVVMSCTSSTDVRVRDTCKVTVAYQFVDDLAARHAAMWSRAKVQDDPVNDNNQPAANVATPKRVKDYTIAPLYMDYAKRSLLDSDKTLDSVNGDIVACAVGIDTIVKTRINAQIPIHVTSLFHQFAALVSENSEG